MPVSSSGLAAGKNFPVHPRDLENETHRRKMVRGINQSAAGAFTPETQLASTDDLVSLEDAAADLGLGLTVTPFIPARSHVIFLATAAYAAISEVVVELKENGSVVATSTTLGLADSYVTLALQALRDLQPDTTYTYTVEAQEGPGENSFILAGATLTVRVEARRLGI